MGLVHAMQSNGPLHQVASWSGGHLDCRCSYYTSAVEIEVESVSQHGQDHFWHTFQFQRSPECAKSNRASQCLIQVVQTTKVCGWRHKPVTCASWPIYWFFDHSLHRLINVSYRPACFTLSSWTSFAGALSTQPHIFLPRTVLLWCPVFYQSHLLVRCQTEGAQSSWKFLHHSNW